MTCFETNIYTIYIEMHVSTFKFKFKDTQHGIITLWSCYRFKSKREYISRNRPKIGNVELKACILVRVSCSLLS